MTPYTTALGCVLAMLAAQNPDDNRRADEGYNKMEIRNGNHRTVHYFARQPGDADSLRDLERAEHEALIASELQSLRLQYIRDEQRLAPIRSAVQARLYGRSENFNQQDSSMMGSFTPNQPISTFNSALTPVQSGTVTSTPGLSPLSPRGNFIPGTNLIGNPAGQQSFSGNPFFSNNGGFTPGMNSGVFGPWNGFNGSNGFLGMNGGTGVNSSFSNFNGSSSPFNGGSNFVGGQSSLLPGSGGLSSGFFNPLGRTSMAPFLNNAGIGGIGGLTGGFGGISGSPYLPFSLYGNTAMATSQQSRSVSFGLQNGVGDEGRIKTAVANALAVQAMPAYQAQTRANLQAARNAVKDRQSYVTLTLKDGDKRYGKLVQQNGDWIVLRDGNEEHMIRTTEVTRMTRTLTPASRAASR